MCLYPKLIKNRKYIANKKNGGVIPPVYDNRVLMVPVGCQKCIECKKQKSRAWSVRLQEEIRNSKNGKFVTLSFSDESLYKLYDDIITQDKKNNITTLEFSNYEMQNRIATLAVRRFLERWRKEFKTSVKHWLVTELGQTKTERIHLHGIIFTDDKITIDKHWKYGNTWIGDYVNEKTVNYIVKYLSKPDLLHEYYNSIVLCSPGIGKHYIDRHDSTLHTYNGLKTRESYVCRNGVKINLPIYYRNKVYNDDEREALWLHKLDKQERWVLGQKISVKDANEENNYYIALANAQMLNKRLKYGDDTINWDKKKYEYERRKLIYKNKAKNDI
jgi:hypothetical protein